MEQYNIKIRNSVLNKNLFIKHIKDPISKLESKGVVYSIKCLQCNSCYVGQTCRKLKERIREHKYNIRQIEQKQNSLTKHRLDKDHNFDFLNPTILNRDSKYLSRLTKETLYIKLQKHTLNTMTERNSFTKIYDPLINIFQK